MPVLSVRDMGLNDALDIIEEQKQFWESKDCFGRSCLAYAKAAEILIAKIKTAKQYPDVKANKYSPANTINTKD